MEDPRPLPRPPCQRCGGPHPFDTSLPSVVWNAVIRAHGLPDYLCLTCIVEAFGCVGDSFTAVLHGGSFQSGLPIEVRFRGEVAKDAAVIQDENNALRWRLREVEDHLTALSTAFTAFVERLRVQPKAPIADHEWVVFEAGRNVAREIEALLTALEKGAE